MPNVTLPAQRRNCTSCPVRLASGPTSVSVDTNAYDSEHEETDSFGFFREVTQDLPGMYAYDAHGHLSAATSGSTPGDGCTDGTGIVNLIYAADDPVNAADPTGLSWWNPTTWSEKTWEGIGVGLGAVALAATGVGIAVDLSVAGTVAVGAVAAGAGAGAEYLDYNGCVNHGRALACAGMAMGGASLLYGTAGTGFALATFEGADSIATGLGGLSLGFGGVGSGVDAIEWGLAKTAKAC
jgi:hypothetical protein